MATNQVEIDAQQHKDWCYHLWEYPKEHISNLFVKKNNFKSIIITFVMMIMVWLVYSSLEAMEIYFGEQRFEYSLGNNIY
jgi:hypothetical protein